MTFRVFALFAAFLAVFATSLSAATYRFTSATFDNVQTALTDAPVSQAQLEGQTFRSGQKLQLDLILEQSLPGNTVLFCQSYGCDLYNVGGSDLRGKPGSHISFMRHSIRLFAGGTDLWRFAGTGELDFFDLVIRTGTSGQIIDWYGNIERGSSTVVSNSFHLNFAPSEGVRIRTVSRFCGQSQVTSGSFCTLFEDQERTFATSSESGSWGIVPLPASGFLLLAGLAGLPLLRKRRSDG